MDKGLKYNNTLLVIGLSNSLFFKLKNKEITEEYNYLGTHVYTDNSVEFKRKELGVFYGTDIEGFPVLDKTNIKDKIDIYFNYLYYILANMTNKLFCIDADSLQLDFTNLVKYIHISIKENNIDQIFYSISNYERTYYDIHTSYILKYNLAILNKLKKFNVPILVGGNGLMNRNHNHKMRFRFNKLKLPIFEEKRSDNITNINLQSLSYSSNIKLLTNYTVNRSVLNSVYNLNTRDLDKDIYINEIVFKFMNSSCLNKCAFCGDSLKIKENNNITNITQKITELKQLQRDFDLNSLLVLDGYINNKFILPSLESSNVKFDIIAGVSLKGLTEETCIRMRNIGVKIANIGIEVYDDESLAFINKGLNTKEIDNGIELLHKHNFILNCNFILGMPNNKKDEYDKILSLVNRYSDGVLNSVRLNIFQLLPNSYFFLNPKKFKISVITTKTGFEFFDGKHTSVDILKNTLPHIIDFNNNNIGKYQIQHYGFGLQLLLLLFKQYNDKSIVWKKYKEIIDGYIKL